MYPCEMQPGLPACNASCVTGQVQFCEHDGFMYSAAKLFSPPVVKGCKAPLAMKVNSTLQICMEFVCSVSPYSFHTEFQNQMCIVCDSSVFSLAMHLCRIFNNIRGLPIWIGKLS